MGGNLVDVFTLQPGRLLNSSKTSQPFLHKGQSERYTNSHLPKWALKNLTVI